MIQQTINFAEPVGMAELLTLVRPLKGKYRIVLTKFAAKRTLAQNRLLWAAINGPVARHLRELGMDVTDQDVHDWLKQQFARKPVFHPETGELLFEKATSRDMEVAEFSEYVERCVAFVADRIGLVLSLPGDWQTEIVEAEVNELLGAA